MPETNAHAQNCYYTRVLHVLLLHESVTRNPISFLIEDEIPYDIKRYLWADWALKFKIWHWKHNRQIGTWKQPTWPTQRQGYCASEAISVQCPLVDQQCSDIAAAGCKCRRSPISIGQTIHERYVSRPEDVVRTGYKATHAIMRPTELWHMNMSTHCKTALAWLPTV